MWQESEKEKDKLKTSRLAFYGKNIKHSAKTSISNEILRIPPSLLQDPEGLQEGIIGKGRFGTVSLKLFRNSPVAVKYFDSTSSKEMIEKEAFYLFQCCHLNLPLLYGMNTENKPYFVVTQFYGIDSLEAITLYKILQESSPINITTSEQWLHMVTQLSDVNYFHDKNLLHNNIITDIIVVGSSKVSFHPS